MRQTLSLWERSSLSEGEGKFTLHLCNPSLPSPLARIDLFHSQTGRRPARLAEPSVREMICGYTTGRSARFYGARWNQTNQRARATDDGFMLELSVAAALRWLAAPNKQD